MPEDTDIFPEPAEVEAYAFGCHRLLPRRRELYVGDRLVEIGARAFDLLALLVANPGRVVPKREVFAAVWPTTMVDESNLRFQVAVLRRALGGERDAVKTVSGRGYLLARAVRAIPADRLMDEADTPDDVLQLREENQRLRLALASLVSRRPERAEPPPSLRAGSGRLPDKHMAGGGLEQAV